jgi:hypothetical protein
MNDITTSYHTLVISLDTLNAAIALIDPEIKEYKRYVNEAGTKCFQVIKIILEILGFRAHAIKDLSCGYATCLMRAYIVNRI